MTTPDYSFYKDLDIEVDVKLNFDVNVEVTKSTDIDFKLYSDIDFKGNVAELTLSLEAIGWDTFVEADVAILTVEDALSSIDLYAVSVVA